MSRVRDFALTHRNSSSKLPFYGYLKRRKLTAVHIDLSHLLINKSVVGRVIKIWLLEKQFCDKDLSYRC